MTVPYKGAGRLFLVSPNPFLEVFMEKFLKEFMVGNAKLILSGLVFTEDTRGRRIPHSCGLFWNPWECDDHTVAAQNSVTIEGDPGSKISIKVYAISLRDRTTIEELKPTFSNSTKEVWVWEYDAPIAIFIDGQRDSESWTVSHWRMLSGRIVFDLAKNKIQIAETRPAVSDNGGNGHGYPDPNDEAGQQLNHGRDKKR